VTWRLLTLVYTDGRAVTLPIFSIDLPIYILDDRWFTAGVENVTRRGLFLNNSRWYDDLWYRVTTLPIFLLVF